MAIAAAEARAEAQLSAVAEALRMPMVASAAETADAVEARGAADNVAAADPVEALRHEQAEQIALAVTAAREEAARQHKEEVGVLKQQQKKKLVATAAAAAAAATKRLSLGGGLGSEHGWTPKSEGFALRRAGCGVGAHCALITAAAAAVTPCCISLCLVLLSLLALAADMRSE